MLDNLRIKILYQFKVLEYKIEAWIKILEISKAYSQNKEPADTKRIPHKSWRLVIYVGFLILGTGVVWGIFKLIQLRPISNPEAAITTKNPEQNHRGFSADDSLLKRMAEMPGSFSVSVETFAQDSAVSFKESFSSTAADYFIILANKKNKTMYLLQNTTGKWKVLRSFDMGIGAVPGRKKTAGDKRTPEGLYFIIERKEKRELSSIYGPLAYVLDYPNQQDRQEGRTGQGIWIHGTEPDSFPGETKGCLEIANDQLLLLASYLKDGIGTPVFIVDVETEDPLSIPDFEMIKNKREKMFVQREQFEKEFKNLLANWEKAWESRDIDRYKEFYDTSGFQSQGIRWKSWAERKIRTFEIYSSIDVTIDKVLLMDISENTATLKFLQTYKSDKNSQENGKQLVLEKTNGSWKITREVTIPKEELLL
jgi:murein L,D-transpeptidase YafK